MAFQISDWIPRVSDIKRAPFLVLLEKGVTAVVTLLGGWLGADFVSPDTRLGFVIVFFGCAFAAAALIGAAGWARRQWRMTAPPAPQVTTPARMPDQKPFLVRFKERQQFYRGLVRDADGYCLLIVEVVNAEPIYREKIEVLIEGETNHLDTRKPYREKVKKLYLRNRRGVEHMSGGQSEEYVVVSMDHDGNAFWGDHKLIAENERVPLPANGQHIVIVTVLSSSTPRVTEKLVIINTSTPEVLPVFPGPTTWILNERG